MKVFVSQPMTGVNQEIVEAVFQDAAKDIRERLGASTTEPIEILSTRNYILPRQLQRGRNQNIAYLSHAIQVMSMADAVYFCEGAEQSRGCAVEHAVAKVYGIPIFRPEGLPV